MNEDSLLTVIFVEQEIAKLAPADADMVLLLYRIRAPLGYTGPWPPRMSDIAYFIGMKYKGKPVNDATIRYRHRKVKRMWLLAHREPSE